MKCDVSVVTEGTGESRHAESRKSSNGVVRRGEAGENQIEPHYIRLQSSDCAQQPRRSRQTVEFPTADHVEAGQLSLPFGLQRLSIFVGSKCIVGQFICQ